MKLFLVIIVLAVVIFFAVQYLQGALAPHSSACPEGTTFARKTIGGVWEATDASDPAGTCVANANIGTVGE